MKHAIRLHIRIEGGDIPYRQWTIDRPNRVSVGFAPNASIWVAEVAAGPATVLFETSGTELCLRALPGMDASLLIEKKVLSIGALRESGLLRNDRAGDYVLMREKTKGTIVLGALQLEFWVTRAPDEPEYPRHPRVLYLSRDFPWTTSSLFLAVFLLEAFVLNILGSLPAPVPPTIQEVTRVYSQYQLPEEYGRRRFKMETSALSEPVPKPSKGALPQRGPGGFLSAVARGRQGGRSPFSSLFTTSSLSGEMEKMISTGDIGKAVTESLKGFGSSSQGLGSAPQALGIGSIRQEGTKEAHLTKTASMPQRSRLDFEGSTGGGIVDRNALEQLVNSRAGELRDCYERALTRNPSLGGKLILRIVLKANGLHSLAADESSTLKDPGLVRCAVSRMAAWPFQTPKNDSDPILLPFIFSAASKG